MNTEQERMNLETTQSQSLVFDCLQPLKEAFHLTVASVSFQTFRAPFEFGFVDVEEEVVKGRSVDEVVPDQSSEEWQQRRRQTRMMTAESIDVVQLSAVRGLERKKMKE